MQKSRSFLIATLILVVLLLGGCAAYECKTAYEMTRDIKNVKLSAYDKNYVESDVSTHWHKLGFTVSQLDEEFIKINGNADFCALDNTEEIELDYSKDDSKTSSMQLFPDDLVFFTLAKPQAYFEKCEDAKNAKELNIKVLNMSKCNKGSSDKDKPYAASVKAQIASPYNTSHKLDVGNMVFYNGKSSIFNKQYSKGKKTYDPLDKFYDVVIPVAEASDTNVDCSAFYSDKSKKYDLDAYFIHKKCNRVCNYFLNTNGRTDSGTQCYVTSSISPYPDEFEDYDVEINGKTETMQRPKAKPDDRRYIQLLLASLQTSSGTKNLTDGLPGGPKADSLGNRYIIEGHYYTTDQKGTVKFKTIRQSGRSEGGYRVKINRDCKLRAKNSIYMYVGNSVPTLAPREANIGGNMYKIPWTDNTLDTNFYEIKKDVLGDGDLYFGFDFSRDDPEKMDNNSGFFLVEGSIPKVATNSFGTIVDKINAKFLKTLYGDKNAKGERCTQSTSGAVCKIYDGIIRNPTSKNIINTMILLYIMTISLLYFLGMSQLNAQSLILSIIKIIIVQQVVQQDSWDFFSANFFNFIIEGPKQVIDMLVNVPDSWGADKAGFAGLNYTVGKMLVPELWYQVFSLLFTSFIGFLAFLMICFSFGVFFIAIVNAVIMYFLATVYNSILVAFSPLFIPMILFKYTSKIFHAWTKVFVKNFIQVLFVFAAIALLNKVQMQLIHAITNYGVCVDCIVDFYISEKLGPVCAIYGPVPDTFPLNTSVQFREGLSSTNNDYGMFALPVGISQILALLINSMLMGTFVKRVVEIAETITGVYVGGVAEAAKKFTETTKGLIGMDKESIDRRASSKAEQAIYSQGDFNPKMHRRIPEEHRPAVAGPRLEGGGREGAGPRFEGGGEGAGPRFEGGGEGAGPRFEGGGEEGAEPRFEGGGEGARPGVADALRPVDQGQQAESIDPAQQIHDVDIPAHQDDPGQNIRDVPDAPDIDPGYEADTESDGDSDTGSEYSDDDSNIDDGQNQDEDHSPRNPYDDVIEELQGLPEDRLIDDDLQTPPDDSDNIPPPEEPERNDDDNDGGAGSARR